MNDVIKEVALEGKISVNSIYPVKYPKDKIPIVNIVKYQVNGFGINAVIEIKTTAN